MTFTDIFFELDSIYSNEWFVDASNKFYAHPSNKNKAESFEIELIDFEKNTTLKKYITLNDFVFGAKDEVFDSIHDELEMNNKLETVGELPNGYPVNKLIEGETFVGSVSFYPNPTLNIWKKKLTTKIDKSLSLITSLSEKELFLNSIASLNKEYKELSKGTTFRAKIFSEIFEQINDYISHVVTEISELNTFIEDNNEKSTLLCFNLDQADLAKLIKFLIDEKIIDDSNSSRNQIIHWFSRNCFVKSKNLKLIKPKSLAAEFRRLSSNTDFNLKEWFNSFSAR